MTIDQLKILPVLTITVMVLIAGLGFRGYSGLVPQILVGASFLISLSLYLALFLADPGFVTEDMYVLAEDFSRESIQEVYTTADALDPDTPYIPSTLFPRKSFVHHLVWRLRIFLTALKSLFTVLFGIMIIPLTQTLIGIAPIPGPVLASKFLLYKTFDGESVMSGHLMLWNCQKCRKTVPLRAKHCRTCNRCVNTYDHHCPWIGNCIGSRNRGLFVAFLAHAELGILWSIPGMIKATASDLVDESNALSAIMLLITIGVLSLSVGILIQCTMLLGHQILLALQGLTTWEYKLAGRISYIGEGLNPFANRDGLSNLFTYLFMPGCEMDEYYKTRSRQCTITDGGDVLWRVSSVKCKVSV